MLDEIARREVRFAEIEQELAKPDAVKDLARFRSLGKEHNDLKDFLVMGVEYRKLRHDLDDHRVLLRSGDDRELAELAKAEIPDLESQVAALENRLQEALLPKDPIDEKSALVEIRAGTGGEEAALFASDLYRMYLRFAERKGWKIDVMNTSPADMGGLKEVVFLVEGKAVYGTLRGESGVHRVQRVPKTEAQGRIHTSAASVMVMPEADDVEVEINPNDVRVDVFRSSGPGGQNVNKTESAVRLTHVPTGLVVSCQDEKSQLKNKTKAMKVLKSRLLDLELERQKREQSAERKLLVRTGDRSEKIRTYNFPQNRVTDHRLTGDDKNHPLSDIIEGGLDELISALRKEETAARLRAVKT